MRNEIWGFLRDYREPDGCIENLLDKDALEDIPEISGAYIFVSDGQKFIYPEGKSKVIYIGKGDNLKKRIRSHYSDLNKIVDMSEYENLQKWRYSRYQYMRKFGCRVFWYTTRGVQSSKQLETNLLADFYDKYFALPVGNGAFSY